MMVGFGTTLWGVAEVHGPRDDVPMGWMVVFVACGVLAACGNAEQPRVARAQAPPLQFVKPPLVVSSRWGGVHVWVRLNRPLRDNEGSLGEHPGLPADIEIAGTSRDIPGLYRDDRHPTCYGQVLFGEIADGEQVGVALVLSPSERVTTTVPAQAMKPAGNGDVRALRRLRCPTDRATRRCRGTVKARGVAGIIARSATNASCRTVRAVMRSVGRWADSRRCYETLCVRSHPINRGFRCSVDLVGEAAWQITCVRGRSIVRGYTAE